MKVDQAMELCSCAPWKSRDLRKLSSGERQLVSMARALVQGAKILFLDEALSQMDLHYQAQIGRLLKNLSSQGYAIVLVSHDLNLASEWSQTGIFMKEGTVVAQGPMRSVLDAELLKRLYPGEAWVVASSPTSGAPKVYFAQK
jgi:iron complex transport system ATP-binding protein